MAARAPKCSQPQRKISAGSRPAKASFKDSTSEEVSMGVSGPGILPVARCGSIHRRRRGGGCPQHSGAEVAEPFARQTLGLVAAQDRPQLIDNRAGGHVLAEDPVEPGARFVSTQEDLIFVGGLADESDFRHKWTRAA